MGLRKPVDLSKLPKNLKPEIAERVAEHFKDGVFEFDFSTEEMIAVEGNTVYHVIPHYTEEDTEKVVKYKSSPQYIFRFYNSHHNILC